MMDRPLRFVFTACGIAAASAFLQDYAVAATPSVQQALELRPIQKDIELQNLDAAAVKAAKVRDIESKEISGWEVVASDGSMLRRFADTNGDKKIDLWCYFNSGVEVYRDIDVNFNGRPDQYRWLGTAGSRWGLDENEDGRIDLWKQISPEEVTAEVVTALRDSDSDRFAALMITPRELSDLGLGAEKSQLVESKAKRALREFSDLAERQKAVGKSAEWVQFAAPTPGVVPSGTDGSTQDVLAYENAVAMFTDGSENGQIMVGTIVKSGSAWRLIDLPSVGNDGESVAQSSGNLFAAASPAMTGANSNLNSKTQELVTKLESIDAQLSKIEEPKESTPLHAQRADVIEALAASAADAAERETWIRQLVDTMSIAVQTGAYPDGAERMEKIATSFADGDETLAAYADYAAINSQYVVRQTPDAEFEKVQEWYLDALAGFVDRYPKTPEAAKAWLQLALVKEFDENETEALDYYKKVASGFPGTDEGFKADGAIRRLESVGQKIELEGTTIEGKPFRLSQLGGKPVVIHYWATWCEPCKQDMQLLRRLQAAYARTGLQLVGINVDGTKEQAEAFIAESRLPWTQLFEPGGLEGSSLANRLGVQTLPTILLIDADGKVVRHNIQAPELDAELQKLTKK
jgi:thiol-disulfide isomerase/thioredoxin